VAVVGISAANANAAVDSVTGAAGGGYLQQYVGVPGAAGTDNQAGSTLRVAVTFPAASGGTATQTGTANIASWAGGSQTLTHGGFWSARRAGRSAGRSPTRRPDP